MKNRALILAVVLFGAQFAQAQDATDAQGCKDSPLISRFPGSVITACKDMDDEAFDFTLDKGGQKHVEGEYHKIEYKFPEKASKAQVVRNLNTALRRAGYTMVYDSGSYGDFTGHMGNTWIQIEISGNGNIVETIVKEKALSQDVVANAAELFQGLTSSGHAVVQGILFDTAKAELKPESAAALQEVAKLMQQNADLKIFVVGHTDNVGPVAANVQLSQRRADAVARALTTQYGVAAARLASFGNGPYAPVATNDTDEGRASNRRVELVKQ